MPPSAEFPINILGISSMLLIISLSFILMLKSQRIQQLSQTMRYLKKSLEEMDEQAKLIVRTDLKLNKAQEELDKRVNGLYAMQRISQELSKTLNQDEIFRRINQEHITNIGFQKAIIVAKNVQGTLQIRHSTGFNEEETSYIEAGLIEKGIYAMVKEYNSTFSSISEADTLRKAKHIITAITHLDSFVLSPISKKDGYYGFILLSNSSAETLVSEGDEELVAILATHIGQALDNAELFEATYSQHQELERNVLARTKELSDALNEINVISKRKTDFVSAVSHELRTPLTSIKGYASILLSEKLGVIPEPVKERLGKINKHSDELTRLVNDLLDIARIESGRFEMKSELFDIRHAVETTIDLLSPQLKEKSITATMNLPQNLSLALADKTQISRVFINLMGNAIKFVPEKTGLISVSAFESTDTIQITISDNGIGMSPTDTEHIFDEFYRVDNDINQKVKGTGLGLTLVKNIIRAHKGRIWVASRLNQGSAFSFTLPKAAQTPLESAKNT
ncbi:MAG: hypothetical protein A2Y00_05705 [Omnitrophica WOR_2 bacterium GWF2_43_52]|nr:MAG: hypothetical protein A2Y00_05705 [Omnitrophica WOR_2 bacterium GWF2_43_52]OGX57564.1 MAG: hypothetical protein A2460_00375 [Omnitrophica WOR_2 bacterium RIFOXYC2_FULL_43_9]HAH21587.1 hypothetical protein [Candidatus Omnitrophota bacterium]HBG64182.1 hypothetical protein [Candidatus Omnitrophota bacterium]HCD38617.1 hypothetical protein [Candidatus Omnitrophota bacterium]